MTPADGVKIRKSQINGCAFWLRMHTRDALTKGEPTDRLAVREAGRHGIVAGHGDESGQQGGN